MMTTTTQKTIDTILAEIDTSLESDRRELIARGETPATDAAIATCKRLITTVGVTSLTLPGLTRDVFADGEGGMNLILMSSATRRHVSVGIAADGTCVDPLSIDENMKHGERPIDTSAAQWVAGTGQ